VGEFREYVRWEELDPEPTSTPPPGFRVLQWGPSL